MHHALTEREELIEHRASAVLDRDLNEGEPWTAALGTKPADARTAQPWRQAGRVVAAYRDRYQITDDTPLGPDAASDAQKLDAARADAALRRAQQLAAQTSASPEGTRAHRRDAAGPHALSRNLRLEGAAGPFVLDGIEGAHARGSRRGLTSVAAEGGEVVVAGHEGGGALAQQ